MVGQDLYHVWDRLILLTMVYWYLIVRWEQYGWDHWQRYTLIVFVILATNYLQRRIRIGFEERRHQNRNRK